MEEASEEQLGAMGLSILPPNLDANPEFDDWAKKAEYHDKIKGNTSQPSWLDKTRHPGSWLPGAP